MLRLFQAAGGGADRFLGMRAGRCTGRSWNNKLFPSVGLHGMGVAVWRERAVD